MNPINNPLSEQELEKHLAQLPRFQMSARGDELFYSKLNTLLATKRQTRYATEDAREADTARSFGFGFKRFAFSFGLGLFAVTASFTGLSYRDSVTYGSLLYPVKQAAEEVEGAVAFTTEQKVNTELRFSDRRLQEGWHIVGNSGDTGAWLIQTAYAQGPVSMNASAAVNLQRTLADLNLHVNNASRIVEAQTLNANEAVSLLDTITKRADEQVASLKQMREQASVENKLAVHLAASNEEKYLVKLIVAREDIRSVAEAQGQNTPVRLAQFSAIMPTLGAVSGVDTSNGFTAREATDMLAARSALSLLEQKVRLLPAGEQARLSARVVEAQRALNEGKTGTAYGLSIALTKQVAQARGVSSTAVVDMPTPSWSPNVAAQGSVSVNTPNNPRVQVIAPQQNIGVNNAVSVFDILDRVNVNNTPVQVNAAPAVRVQQNVNQQPVNILPTDVYITPDVNVNFSQPAVNVQQQPVQVQQPAASVNVQQQPVNISPINNVQINPATQVQVNPAVNVQVQGSIQVQQPSVRINP